MTHIPTLGALRAEADIAISLALLEAAVPVAEAVPAQSPCPGLVFIDVNSTHVDDALGAQNALGSAGVDVVDAATYGLATRLEAAGVLMLSRHRASDIAGVLSPEFVQTVVLDCALDGTLGLRR